MAATNLATLPAEILQDIFALLDYPTLHFLAATHPRFQPVADFEKARRTTPASEVLDQLVHASTTDPYFLFRRMAVCNICLCIRYRWEFCDGVIAHRKLGERFCTECGIRCGLTPPGALFSVGEMVLP